MDEDTGGEMTAITPAAAEDAEEDNSCWTAFSWSQMTQPTLGFIDSTVSLGNTMTQATPTKSTGRATDPRIIYLQEQLFGPTVLVFVPMLNTYLPEGGRKRQQELAMSIGVVSAALSHYKAGRRTPSIEIVRSIARALVLPPADEKNLISAWFYDREIVALRNYFDAIVQDGAYDRLPLISMRLEHLYESYFAARHTGSTTK